jgi:hypothetical protein
MSMVAKDESLKEVRTFKQEDINHMKIAYMPPLTSYLLSRDRHLSVGYQMTVLLPLQV